MNLNSSTHYTLLSPLALIDFLFLGKGWKCTSVLSIDVASVLTIILQSLGYIHSLHSSGALILSRIQYKLMSIESCSNENTAITIKSAI